MENKIIEIRLHGRGGQGAITSAKIMAKGALRSGYKGVVMVPSFGTERRGAPVLTSLKIANEKIYDLSDSEFPHIVIVLDHSILGDANVLQGLKPGGTLIINSPNPPERYHYDGIMVAAADVTAISGEAGLTYGTVSSGIIGAFAKASSLIRMETLAEVIREEFEGRNPEENVRAALVTYERTRCSEIHDGNKAM